MLKKNYHRILDAYSLVLLQLASTNSKSSLIFVDGMRYSYFHTYRYINEYNLEAWEEIRNSYLLDVEKYSVFLEGFVFFQKKLQEIIIENSNKS